MSTWEAMLAGRSGVKSIDDEEHEWVRRFELPIRIAAPMAVSPDAVLPRVQARRLDRCEQVALVAAKEAWADAGLGEPGEVVDPDRLAVVIGTGIGGAATLLDQDDVLEGPGLRKVSPLTVPMLMPNGPAAWVGLEFKARASVHSPVSACASGAEALAWAVRLLRAGEADVVIAGGARPASPASPSPGSCRLARSHSATTSQSAHRGRSTRSAMGSCSARARA